MRGNQIFVRLALLFMLVVVSVPVHLRPAAAQDPPLTCDERLEQAEQLRVEAQAALEQNNIISAMQIIQQIEDMLAPCVVEAPSTGIFTVGQANQWNPVERVIDGVLMVQVPGGCFLMGSAEGLPNEEPVHEICFQFPYWLDKTEVTRGMYAECVEAGECTRTSEAQVSTRDTQPITRVTWFQARDYCAWRGLELPTEAEWEYAARGPAGWAFPWGNQFEGSNVVYSFNSEGVTADVGSRPQGASWVGAVDMSGNVAEWVRSVYRPYPFVPTTGLEDAPRVVRGGSFYLALSSYLNTTRRENYTPSFERESIGFRCARPTVVQPALEDSCEVRTEKALFLISDLQITLENGAISYSLLLLDDARDLIQPCIDNARWTPVVEQINDVDMVQVPAGCFTMGRDAGASDEQPAHELCFDRSFWLDETEVTRDMYAECVTAGACTPTLPSEYSVRGAQPINRVTWLQAGEYCAWREARLPTEAEWEYAARGPNNLLYPWGISFGVRQVVYNNRLKGTEDVGSRPSGASWVGALDMSGNVGEWVSSIYSDYPFAANDGRENPGDLSSPRVWRGGSFLDIDDDMLTTVVRKRANPTYENHSTGFRCARSD